MIASFWEALSHYAVLTWKGWGRTVMVSGMSWLTDLGTTFQWGRRIYMDMWCLSVWPGNCTNSHFQNFIFRVVCQSPVPILEIRGWCGILQSTLELYISSLVSVTLLIQSADDFLVCVIKFLFFSHCNWFRVLPAWKALKPTAMLFVTFTAK